ncbi:hypothetical protein BB560_002829 [Smittium megazygosporum]|uniref:Palmitoyltransferase n=1 Tax=Smittium megazygosporum TaxID=133381 RepID=A0A2T9ZDT9_9FUNG|nr:hypothetical protein BB560_002829 [Smittium megazygosporum]
MKSSSPKENNLLIEKREKVYKIYGNENILPIKGSAVTSKKIWPFIISILLLLTPIALFSIFIVPFLLSRFGAAPLVVFIYISLLSLTSLFASALTDPGILPRNLDAVIDSEEFYVKQPPLKPSAAQNPASTTIPTSTHLPTIPANHHSIDNSLHDSSSDFHKVLGRDSTGHYDRSVRIPTHLQTSRLSAFEISQLHSNSNTDSHLLQPDSPFTKPSPGNSTSPSPIFQSSKKALSLQSENCASNQNQNNLSKQIGPNTKKYIALKYSTVLPPPFPIPIDHTQPEFSPNNTTTQSPISHLPPSMKIIDINGTKHSLKYCNTCRIYRPPRATHCRQCDNCIEVEDHHCAWVNNCVGKRNYRYFYTFLCSTSLLCFYVFGFSLYHLIHVSKNIDLSTTTNSGFAEAISKNPISLLLVIYSVVFGWFVVGLFLFHTFLVFSNITTHEYIRSSSSCFKNNASSVNPIYNPDSSLFSNFYIMLCRPRQPPTIPWKGLVHFNENPSVYIKK